MRKTVTALIIVLAAANLFQYGYIRQYTGSVRQSAKINASQQIKSSLLRMSAHIKKLEHNTWSDPRQNQEVFERMDDVIHAVNFSTNINLSTKSAVSEDIEKIGKIAVILREKYRGNEHFYEERTFTAEMRDSLSALSDHIDAYWSEPWLDSKVAWRQFLEAVDAFILAAGEKKASRSE